MKHNHSKVEKKWQKKWFAEKVYEPDLKSAKNPFYNLMMFPYPSAEGLHVGNMYAFVGSDIHGRFKRMQGHDVFEPIGLDGFGIHSENYALKIGQHPMDQAKVSEKNFYRQLAMIGNGFAWNEKLETYDPEYYKWTQWIFIQLFKKGLAYRKKALVNWCPSCLTVLADEQVISGECERCSTKVIKKELDQWFFKITQYADKLLKGLDTIDWSEKVKIAQRNWIGKSEGAMIKFALNVPGQPDGKHSVEVFTTRPDTLFGATYLAVSPELAQKWIDMGWQAPTEVKGYINKHRAEKAVDAVKEKTGVFSGVMAINPANNEKIPVWVADYVLAGYGTGAVMAVPAHDQRDWDFAKKYDLSIIPVVISRARPIWVDQIKDGKIIQSDVSSEIEISEDEQVVDIIKKAAYEGKGVLINSERFNGLDSEKAKWEIVKSVGGKKQNQFRLRDWLISRQRYWGAPIPMIYCEKCGWQPVPEEDLPVRLPYIKNFRPTGTSQSPLAADEKFYKIKCPKCGEWARRETDVSDTFLDSAWYYLGYLILGSKNEKVKSENLNFDKEIIGRWCPVDMYIGGAEHSVLHLLYVRFLAMVFKDLGLTNFDEPFKKFRAHGLIIKDGAKMSKSKGNVINPDDYISKYGADALRMYLMFLGPFDQGGDFREGGIKGLTRFLERVWKISNGSYTTDKSHQPIVHKTIKKVTEDIENLNYNTAVSALMILLNELESAGSVSREVLEVFVKLLAPFAPYMAEEIWRGVFGSKESIHISEWPKYDTETIKEKEVNVVVQVNAKMRAVIKLPTGSSQKEVEEAAKNNENISKYLTDNIKKVIFVKDKFINFVV